MVIHLIAPQDKSKWDLNWIECFKSVKNLPYEIKLWDDEEDINHLLKTYDNDFYQNYLSKLPKIYRIDYARYLILQHYPGVYLDMDVEVVHDFIPFLRTDTSYFLEGKLGEYITNAIMVTFPHPKQNIYELLASSSKYKIIQNFEKCLINPSMTLEVSGPLFLSNWVVKNLPTNPHIRYQVLAYNGFNNPLYDFAVCRHYHTNSWRKTQ